MKRLFQLVSIGLLTSAALLVTGAMLTGVRAEEYNPPNRDLPGRRDGGGVRGCVVLKPGSPSQLISLMPSTNLGLTTEAYPTFYWYMPRSRAQQVSFSLYKADPTNLAQKELVYQTTMTVTGREGIASLTLPSSAGLPPLELEQDYQWEVALVCNPNAANPDLNPRVIGWVQRVTLSDTVAARLAGLTPSEQAPILAENGIWFDTLDILVDLRQAHPDDETIKARWDELLESINLLPVASQTFVGS